MKDRIAIALHEIFVIVREIFRRLTPAQRRAVYKMAVAAGVALVVKFGVSAEDATEVVETIGIFVMTVLVPALAHGNVNDD